MLRLGGKLLRRIRRLVSRIPPHDDFPTFVDQYAPYPLDIYERLITTLARQRDVCFPSFTVSEPAHSAIRIFFRHDVDTRRCVENILNLVEIDRKHRLPSAVYFRVDDDEYCLGDYRETVQMCREAGCEVGLHTICYCDDDYLTAFRRETDKFFSESGFRPTSFSVHGLGTFRLDIRLRFNEEIVPLLADFGYRFTDCHSSLRSYRYVIEDCHFDNVRKQRYIRADFRRPRCCSFPGDFLVLTHPCYWSDKS